MTRASLASSPLRSGTKQARKCALNALTRQHSTFTKHDLARFASRHMEGAEQFASVLAMETGGERLTVRLDGPGGSGGAGAGPEGKDSRSVVTFSVRDYGHVDHGYTATTKAQGATSRDGHA